MAPVEDKRLAILDAAASVFMRLGFAATSLDDISEALGATKGTLYYHFRSKTSLFFAVQRRAMELLQAAIEPLAHSDGNARDRLESMAFAHSKLMMEDIGYLRVAGQGLELHLSVRTSQAERIELDAITELRDAHERLYIEVIADGVARGEFRDVDPRIVVKPLFGALNWTSRWYQPRDNETAQDRAALAGEIARFAVHAFLPAVESDVLIAHSEVSRA
ncbi:TetR family transcriptional regulator [Antricoccus suffuscus]|uniref:TetR family transcriptional regulator n=1 Tax=Antricoccus suffuscus TaxID=1629062 RepID=A0A2T0ZWQ9_9ACTN|nr:TetR/AcrR family transcriptional regulator [Antricoccus suffuscus]PRZ40518.1 TetR family transcriptional regulator [Antricoccus suffuscus]